MSLACYLISYLLVIWMGKLEIFNSAKHKVLFNLILQSDYRFMNHLLPIPNILSQTKKKKQLSFNSTDPILINFLLFFLNSILALSLLNIWVVTVPVWLASCLKPTFHLINNIQCYLLGYPKTSLWLFYPPPQKHWLTMTFRKRTLVFVIWDKKCQD